LQVLDNDWDEGLMFIREHSAFCDILKRAFVTVQIHI